MATKIWQKETIVNSDIERYTIGKDAEMDMYIARYDVLGSMAHAKMLESIGLLEKTDLSAILKGLKEIFNQIENDEFVIELYSIGNKLNKFIENQKKYNTKVFQIKYCKTVGNVFEKKLFKGNLSCYNIAVAQLR